MLCEQNEITNLKPLTFLSEKCTINLKQFTMQQKKIILTFANVQCMNIC